MGTVRALTAGTMRPYSTDLRERIVDAYHQAEGSVREVAARFKVAPKTVQNYLNRKRETGTVEPRPHGGGPSPKLDDAGVRELRIVVKEKNDRTLDEIADELDRRCKVRVGRSTVWRIMDQLGITRKKNTTRVRRRAARGSGGARTLPAGHRAG
jgi:transposase